MADLLRRELGVEAELVAGGRGEFTVWVGEKVVAQKGWRGFPTDEKILAATRAALAE